MASGSRSSRPKTPSSTRSPPSASNATSRSPAATRSRRSRRSATPSSRQGQARVRAEGRRVPEVLVADGHEHRRAEVPRGAPSARPERETSVVEQMIGYKPSTPSAAGARTAGYFAYEDEAPRSRTSQGDPGQPARCVQLPVWFNVGFEEKPQCSACFILSIDDSMESILDWIRREGVIFRGGSGSGVNLLRCAPPRSSSRRAAMLSAGQAMRGADASAGNDQVRRRGRGAPQDGRPRRRPRHRGVHLVQGARRGEGARARGGRWLHVARLGRLVFDPVRHQNANNPVRVTDAFMEAASAPTPTGTSRPRPTGPSWRLSQRASSCTTWPRRPGAARTRGVQYDTTINPWAHAAEHGPDQRVQPEAGVHVDRRLGVQPRPLNLLKFRREDGELDVEAFEHAVDVVFLAQEILNGYSSYPTSRSRRTRRRTASSGSATRTSARC